MKTGAAPPQIPMPLETTDRRTTPARADLAAAHLRGQVEAARFEAGETRRLIAPVAALRRAAAAGSAQETQAIYGETIVVYEVKDGWAWGQLERDSYVGYLEANSLGPLEQATHRIDALRTHAYPGPSIKLPPVRALPFSAQIAVRSTTGDFALTADGLHLWARHLQPLAQTAPDFVAVAERFLGAPYLWGGRTPQGVDCSGLVQTALAAAGVEAPRDSDQQERQLGAPIAGGNALSDLRRGDLVFWKGHVGVMRDAKTLLHASGWHMSVVSERLSDARERISEKACEPITSIRRLEL